MTIPDFQSLMRRVLEKSANGEIKTSDVVEALANDLGLSNEERAQLLPSGRQTTFANRVHWAKSYLNMAGLVENTRRAHFHITSRGSEVLGTGPDRIDIQFLSQFPEFAARREGKESGVTPSDHVEEGQNTTLTPDETIRQAQARLETALSAELLARVSVGTPAFFESVVVRLLIAMGYGGSVSDLSSALIGGAGDGGADGVISQDPLGLDRIYVQAKRYSEGNTVGSGAIRDFFGSLDRFKATKGLFVTTSTFSPSARETAELLSKRIVLVDGPQLARLMIRHCVGCRAEETIEIKRIDDEFFEV